METDYFLWRGGFENRQRFYINSSERRWKVATSIKHPKTLTNAEPEPMILFNSFPKREPLVESFPVASDWRSIRPPYRSELRRMVRRNDDYGSQLTSLPNAQACIEDHQSKIEALLFDLRHSHAALIRAIVSSNAQRRNPTRPLTSATTAEAAAIVAEIERLQAVREQLERQVCAAQHR